MDNINDSNVFSLDQENVKVASNVKKFVNTYSIQDVITDFLKSVSNSDLNCFAVKGCMALNNHFLNKELPFARLTQDLDLHCYSKEDWENFVHHSSEIATKNSSLGLSYRLAYRRGFDKNPNGDSLKYEAISPDGSIIDFKVDMNFGGDIDIISYDNCISFYSIPVILSDKLHVLQSKKICRRIKDLIDVYLICDNFDLNYFNLCSKIEDRLSKYGRVINFENLFFLDNSNLDLMCNAFMKYDQSSNLNISFEDLYSKVLSFVMPIYFYLSGSIENLIEWDSKEGKWI